MLKIDVYATGTHTRVRLHHHAADRDGRCNDDCDEYAVERAYHEHGETARDYRNRVTLAVVAAMQAKTMGHVAFQSLVGEQLSFPLDL